MAKITQLPNTCSAFYLSHISEMDDFKKLISDHMAADHQRNAAARDKHACCYFTSVVSPAVINKLKQAGFIKAGGYFSHRHARNVSFLMMRPTNKMEWDSGKAAFPKKKARATKSK